jgi:hypothetical protein
MKVIFPKWAVVQNGIKTPNNQNPIQLPRCQEFLRPQTYNKHSRAFVFC